MAINLVTFAAQTVTPQDDALIYETALTGSGVIYGAEVTIKSANVLTVASGHGALCGRKFTIEQTDIPVALTSSGSLLGRVYIHMDLSDIDEPISFMVETGESLTPVIQNTDVNINNGVYEINLATFDVDTSTISNLVNVAPQISSVEDLLTEKIDKTSIKNNLTTTDAGFVLDARQGKTLNDTITNKHKITRKTVNTSSWSTDTTSQSGTTLYKKTISLSHVYVTSPSVDISTSNGSGLPTAAQQKAYDNLQYVTVDSSVPCLYLYSKAIPSTTYYIKIEGVD